MSVNMKSNLKKSSRIIGIFLFAFLFFFNITILFSDDDRNADISILGLKINLFETAFAENGGGGGGSTPQHGRWVYYPSYELCRCEPIQLGDVWECTGLWSWSTNC